MPSDSWLQRIQSAELAATMFRKRDPAKTRFDERLSKISHQPKLALPKKKPISNNQRTERHATFRMGEIAISGSQTLTCVVRDLSNVGARITLEGAIGLPPKALFIVGQSGIRKQVRVVWQDGTEAGLQFIPGS